MSFNRLAQDALRLLTQYGRGTYSHDLSSHLKRLDYKVLGIGYSTVTVEESPDTVLKVVYIPDPYLNELEMKEKMFFIESHQKNNSSLRINRHQIINGHGFKFLLYDSIKLEPISEQLAAEMGMLELRGMRSFEELKAKEVPDILIPAIRNHLLMMPDFIFDIKPANVMRTPTGDYVVIDAMCREN